jgi:hypothetical protein
MFHHQQFAVGAFHHHTKITRATQLRGCGAGNEYECEDGGKQRLHGFSPGAFR